MARHFYTGGALPFTVYGYGFSPRKRKLLKRFVAPTVVKHVSQTSQIPDGATVLIWGHKQLTGAQQKHWHIVRVEDGFLRSVGLGAGLIDPISWVIDQHGMYYDSSSASDLENILQNYHFSEVLLQRAITLQHAILQNGITKYNVGTTHWFRPLAAKRVILVPGQVEDDASLKYGAPGVHTNKDLLQAVRRANPAAYVLYKPHPDVLAGLRHKSSAEDDCTQWCDEVIGDVEMGKLLNDVDEVHVMTSLSGFEALLRGKPVTCYGQPFYAGWGLTKDIMPVARRSRQLSLPELVAGTLLLYPTYASLVTHQRINAEDALQELIQWKQSGPVRYRWWAVYLQKLCLLWRSK